MDNQIYIVTGATGHLGGYILRTLLRKNRTVRALVMPGENLPNLCSAKRAYISQYTGDIRDKQSLRPLFASGGAELVVIHCAGIVTISKKANQNVYDVNVGGTANVLALCREFTVKRLVYVSSVHAIPPQPKGRPTEEVADFHPDFVTGFYDKTKAEATKLVLDAAKQGLDAVVVHPSGIIGPNGMPQGNMTQMFVRYLRGKLPAAVRGGYDFVDVRDVAEGVVAAAEKGRSGECYILSNRFIDLHEMFAVLSKAEGRRKPLVFLPLWMAKAFAPLAETYYRVARKTPLFTRYSLNTLASNGMYSHEKATRELGYRTRPLQETLADTVAWAKNLGKRKKSLARL